MNIIDIQNEIIEDFSLLETWDEKYAYIIELGKKLPPMDEKYKTEDNKIKGCQSNVWLHAYSDNDKLFFQGDSDALIVKGLVSLLIKVFSGQPPEVIVQTEPFFIDKIGMKQHLSMTRANGLASMVKQIKLYALALQQAN